MAFKFKLNHYPVFGVVQTAQGSPARSEVISIGTRVSPATGRSRPTLAGWKAGESPLEERMVRVFAR